MLKKNRKATVSRMELEIIKKQPNLLEFVIKGERHTFPNLLRAYLLEDSSVTFASYLLEHPTDKNARFVLRTRGKNPKPVLAAACKHISADLAQFVKGVKKAVK